MIWANVTKFGQNFIAPLWWFGLTYCRTFIKFLINFILTVKKNDKAKHNTEYIISQIKMSRIFFIDPFRKNPQY